MIRVQHVHVIQPLVGVRQATRPSDEPGVSLWEREDGAVLRIEESGRIQLIGAANVKHLEYHATALATLHAELESLGGPVRSAAQALRDPPSVVYPAEAIDGEAEPDLRAEFPAPPAAALVRDRSYEARRAELDRERTIQRELRAHAAGIAASADAPDGEAGSVAAALAVQRAGAGQAAQMAAMSAQVQSLQAQLARAGNHDRDPEPETRGPTAAAPLAKGRPRDKARAVR